MSVVELLEEVESRGASVEAVDGQLAVDLPEDFPDHLVERLRQQKTKVIELLARKPSCQNPVIPHINHEHPWECDPDECYCYSRFRYPRLCQGAPCRWVWPDGVPIKLQG